MATSASSAARSWHQQHSTALGPNHAFLDELVLIGQCRIHLELFAYQNMATVKMQEHAD